MGVTPSVREAGQPPATLRTVVQLAVILLLTLCLTAPTVGTRLVLM